MAEDAEAIEGIDAGEITQAYDLIELNQETTKIDGEYLARVQLYEDMHAYRERCVKRIQAGEL